MIIRAYGKINLGLDVLRRLPNGYHEVKMVMQSVGIYDELTIERQEEAGIRLTSNVPGLPCDDGNLIVKAARLFMETTGEQFGVQIHLEKHIPMAAGMAGGSADAAACFCGLNEMMGKPLSIEECRKQGVKIGADVPFCMEGGTQLSEGIGEVLTRLPDYECPYILIAKPDIDVSTKYVYENLHVDTLTEHPDMDGMTAAIKNGDRQGVLACMENVLQNVTEKKYPVITSIKQKMIEAGACNSMMSGSGPTVFGIFDSSEKLEEAYTLLKASGLAKTIEKTGTVKYGYTIKKR